MARLRARPTGGGRRQPGRSCWRGVLSLLGRSLQVVGRGVVDRRL